MVVKCCSNVAQQRQATIIIALISLELLCLGGTKGQLRHDLAECTMPSCVKSIHDRFEAIAHNHTQTAVGS